MGKTLMIASPKEIIAIRFKSSIPPLLATILVIARIPIGPETD